MPVMKSWLIVFGPFLPCSVTFALKIVFDPVENMVDHFFRAVCPTMVCGSPGIYIYLLCDDNIFWHQV